MAYLAPYHIAEQRADALLGPLAAAVGELERRALHYTARLHLTPAGRESITAAHRALAAARAELERLQAEAARR
jgi:hypothetical protein